MPTKLSSTKVAHLLRDASTALSVTAAERDKLAARVAELEEREDCAKLAQAMHAKGIEADVPVDDLVAHLQKQAAAGKLAEITRAVDMVGPNMSFASGASNNTVGEGLDSFTNYILGNVG